MNRYRRAQEGVTLIELMVVLVVVAILGSIAVGSYRRYMMRANRTEATATLLALQVAQEKFFLQNQRYATNAELSAAPPAGLGLALDGAGNTENGYYTIAVANPSVTQYTATATAAAGQVEDTDCPAFSISESGTRTPDPVATHCWR